MLFFCVKANIFQRLAQMNLADEESTPNRPYELILIRKCTFSKSSSVAEGPLKAHDFAASVTAAFFFAAKV